MNTARPGRPRPGVALRLTGLALATFAVLLALAPRDARADQGFIGPSAARVHWQTIPHAPCDGQAIALRFRLCECAWDLRRAGFDIEGRLTLELTGTNDRVCVRCVPDSFEVALPGGFTAGNHALAVQMFFHFDDRDSTATHDDTIPFFVQPCSTPIPYLQTIHVGGGSPCEGCPSLVCPNDSIDVRLGGAFPDACRELLGVALVPSPALSPLPQPPSVRITYGNRASCSGCSQVPTPWFAHVRLPGLPYLGGAHQALPIEAEERNLCLPDSAAEFLGRIAVPFVVAESCSTSPPGFPCFNVTWSREDRRARCNATYDNAKPAELALGFGSTEAIAGVQGTLRLDTEALVIDAVESARPGWVVQVSRNPDGSVDFIAFAGTGSDVIPPQVGGNPVDVLDVRVRVGELRILPPDPVRLAATDLLVSDPAGHAIRPCPVVTASVEPPPWVALLCRDTACDANDDGRSDVRDLVVMIGCLYPPPNADPSLACNDSTALDCNASGGLDLDDVFCCARHMLGGDGPGPVPGDTTRAAPDVALRFGLPRDVGDGTIEVPLSFEGLEAAGVAAARVDLAYPDARYEVVEVTFDGPLADWWTFHKVDGSRLRLALLDLSGLPDRPAVPSDVHAAGASAHLTLRLRPGASPGGELVVSGHEFAADDGVILSTPNAETRLALGSSGLVLLSAARPNPFGAHTTFALTLPAAGPVDVGVFDVAGRRVATLLRESSAVAGVYTLGWNGTDDTRGRAVGGVYFVRVVTGAGEVSRKLLFLPGGTR
jgi:hypothetical protein